MKHESLFNTIQLALVLSASAVTSRAYAKSKLKLPIAETVKTPF
ncbi:hypothetical protein [Aliiglaciecola aliphaticivorans]